MEADGVVGHLPFGRVAPSLDGSMAQVTVTTSESMPTLGISIRVGAAGATGAGFTLPLPAWLPVSSEAEVALAAPRSGRLAPKSRAPRSARSTRPLKHLREELLNTRCSRTTRRCPAA